MSNNLLFLSQADIIECGGEDIAIAVDAMEKVFSLHQKNDYILPNKSVLRWGDMDSESTRGRINSMPASIGGDYNSVGIKWISSAPQNPDKFNLPRATGIIILNDYETLVPVAVMDGMLLSAMRTGANSGVAARYLAKEDSEVLGLVGAGAQNKTQLMAMAHVMKNLKKVKITDLNKQRAQEFANEMSEKTNLPIVVCDTAEEAVRDSDIVITATVTKTPIVKPEWIGEGTLYIHVGSHECEFGVIDKADKIVVDDWEELKHRGVETISIMYNEGKFDPSNIHAQLGEVVNGVKSGRENSKEFIYFNSVGMGIQDVALASIVFEKAKEKGVGQELSLWGTAGDSAKL
ncbi:ornithine cyclodeaminase family protein [Sporosarcina oncorhynchi]|uniref:Ornithine cyclodeaminase family protein n=2 Tax=Sporosarcina oncorhynchi TaxID=3056444 RepID=A0ABZ0L931_9BACL|nr:ornithine cyclodeaminase family protein [Sporosarcina sp. T2O-4]WOV88152.1 ornithine cyclodeaminase family protein [Sporosarcina sp. T2O-4]